MFFPVTSLVFCFLKANIYFRASKDDLAERKIKDADKAVPSSLLKKKLDREKESFTEVSHILK